MPDRNQPLTPPEFVEKWKGRRLTERAGSHVHFIELCQALDVPYPHQHRGEDDGYCFDALTAAAGSHAYARTRLVAGERDAANDKPLKRYDLQRRTDATVQISTSPDTMLPNPDRRPHER